MSTDADAGIGNPGLDLQDPQVTALITRLRLVLCDDEHVDAYKKLLKKRGSEAQSLLDVLQKLLNLSGLESSFCRRILVAIQRLSNRSGLYPTSYELKDVVTMDEHPVDFGGFADIFRGMCEDQKVCLKAIRLRPSQNAEATHKRALKVSQPESTSA
ncbi:hypothetical protein H0H92_008469 [Tricholoma furcatifolium]|nr:hypothetical protein H0H92_008469 [Tricholoma furcatifolium]